MRPNTAPYEAAFKEIQGEEPDWERAYRHLVRAHKAGDARATYAIGTWYLHGQYLPKRRQKGLAYIRKAADQGIAPAMFDLAVALETGDGVRKSSSRAAESYLKAALLGDREAMYETGRCLYYGIGIAQDRRLARIFLEFGRPIETAGSDSVRRRETKTLATRATAARASQRRASGKSSAR